MIGKKKGDIFHLLKKAAKKPLRPLGPFDQKPIPILNRTEVQAILPHRDPFLLIDEVTTLDLEESFISAHYDLARAEDILAGHFPNYPIWPGVLQVEAIGQAGIILYLKQIKSLDANSVNLTHIEYARFIRPVTPGDKVTLMAYVYEDGLFMTVVGQCLQNGCICSIAAANILTD